MGKNTVIWPLIPLVKIKGIEWGLFGFVAQVHKAEKFEALWERCFISPHLI